MRLYTIADMQSNCVFIIIVIAWLDWETFKALFYGRIKKRIDGNSQQSEKSRQQKMENYYELWQPDDTAKRKQA